MSLVRTALEFVKVEHSLFAVPFVLAGFVLGLRHAGRLDFSSGTLWLLLLVIVAAVGARTAAMALNRIIDAGIDRLNPRTAGRALPAGAMGPQQAWIIAAAGFAALFPAAGMLNPLCLALAPVLVVLFVVYPYTKRFTWTCHFFLGLAWAAGPVGGFLAVTGSFEGLLPAVLLASSAVLWLAGFDMIYAVLDIEVDRDQGLHSAPARFGVKETLLLSSTLHAVMLLPLTWLAIVVLPLSPALLLALAGVTALLAYEHWIADASDPSRINRAFFHANAAVGWALLGGVLAAVAGF